jgi:predicted nucleic acid-binding protein
MSGIYLLDTNAAVDRINQEMTIIDKLQTADEIILSTIVLGELFYGAEHSGAFRTTWKRSSNSHRAERF